MTSTDISQCKVHAEVCVQLDSNAPLLIGRPLGEVFDLPDGRA